jgi:hypothetical protein
MVLIVAYKGCVQDSGSIYKCIKSGIKFIKIIFFKKGWTIEVN